MSSVRHEIVSHYERYNEAERLTKENRLEFLRTVEIMQRHLEPPPAVVVDVGGGPGAYASWLGQQGYGVHLFDIVPDHVKTASTIGSGLLSAEIADARHLPVEDGSADAVLLLGPLYHLVERGDRIQALGEARRILRPGGRLFAAGISRFASVIDGTVQDLLADPAFRDIVEGDLADGQHRNPTNHPHYFTTAFFHEPRQLLEEVREAGFVEAELLAVESIGWAAPNLSQVLEDPESCNRLLDTIRRLESEPSLLGASPHLLAIARRAQ